MIAAALMLVALLIDRWVGEPPNALHPVVWIGTCVNVLKRIAPSTGMVPQLLWSGCVALLVPVLVAYVTHVVLSALAPWPASSFVVSALLLKCSFSLDGLRKAGVTMARALAKDIGAARHALRNLCSRDPSQLTRPQLIAATVESLSENASDSVIAPLFYYVLFGVPGALAYRAVNTLDAMIGYHGRYEYLGKVAARLDDMLNIIPARLTALLLLATGRLSGGDVREGWRVMLRDRSKTESPNAGWPMAAMAGLLRVQLEKEGHYVLGDAHEDVSEATIARAWRIVRGAAWCGALLSMAIMIGWARWR